MIKRKSKKNILFYYMNGNSGGGSDNSLYLHLINLNKDLFTPIVIIKKRSDLVKKLESMGLLIVHQNFFSSSIKVRLKFPGSKTIFFNLRVVIESLIIIKKIIKYNIDIIHLNNNVRINRAAAIAGLLTFTKVIVHDRMGFKLGLFDKFLLKRVYKIIAISDTVKKQYLHVKLKENKIITIYNGLNIEQFSQKNKIDNSELTIGYVGRLVSWKGVDVLINSFVYVNEVFENVKLLIVGEGEEREKLETLSKELNIQTRVSFLGKLDNINEVYNKMDIFVHTAIEPEPFGRVIIEAMASGLPVITTNIGGPTEIITNEKDGYLLSPGNPKKLAAKIINLIENIEVRNEIGKQAIFTVKKYFDIKNTTVKIENIYKNI